MLKQLLPATLKYKLFTAFILLIIAPLLLISLYGFGKIEEMLEEDSIESSKRQIADMQMSFIDLLGMISKSQISMSQNPLLVSHLKDSSVDGAFKRRQEIEETINSYSNSFFLSTPPVYITLVNHFGDVYHTYTPVLPIDGDVLLEEARSLGIMSSRSYNAWIEEPNYLYELTQSSKLLTMVAAFKNEDGKPYAVARLSVDHTQWFNSLTKRLADGEQLYIIDAEGRTIFHSDQTIANDIPQGYVPASLKNNQPQVNIDQSNRAIYTTAYLTSLQWTIVKRVPFHIVYSEALSLRQSFLYVFIAVTAMFILVTFLISYTFTKPVRLLQKQMRNVTKDIRKTRLSQDGLRGEMLDLAVSFNHMIVDLNEMVYKLKAEERMKESIRFQVLHSQMNPHFLLNTLNILKSQAVIQQDDTSFQICVALGKLLETCLNVEVDLIRLEEELDMVQAYVSIQNFRFADRFAVVVERSDELQYALVPKLTLQPLVENAIVHGFSRSKEKGHISIRVYTEQDSLVIRIRDDGIGLEKAAERKLPRKRQGIGIVNIQERLTILFKQEASLTVMPVEGGTEACLRMPLLVAKPYEGS
ncbi:cache domain-containing sensor histidine kinase [Paenibacillus soyae]|uniref:Histidine kinase n=1 Tax=Paenibacillus soyae TaxID=2969249 RepID=A0A9X2MSD9_9BACL|nr:histidine kinase [Paenibacillus soyae]MCR2805427.1 histidine kinase [Paenibacillus soyae]